MADEYKNMDLNNNTAVCKQSFLPKPPGRRAGTAGAGLIPTARLQPTRKVLQAQRRQVCQFPMSARRMRMCGPERAGLPKTEFLKTLPKKGQSQKMEGLSPTSQGLRTQERAERLRADLKP